MKIYNDGRFVDEGLNWIYIGADINNKNWSKVGKTKNRLSTRSTSSQNPGYFIFCAFQIKHGSIHEMESKLIGDLEKVYQRISHFSTGEPSEWFVCNPVDMKYAVISFIENKFGSAVYYANDTHGGPVNYSSDPSIERYFSDPSMQKPQLAPKLSRHFFAGNNEPVDFFNGDEAEFDSNHPDYINDYKTQWIYDNS